MDEHKIPASSIRHLKIGIYFFAFSFFYILH